MGMVQISACRLRNEHARVRQRDAGKITNDVYESLRRLDMSFLKTDFV